MSTITRDQLRERAREKVKSLEFAVTQDAFSDSRAELEEELELARIALASLKAEPVAWLLSGGGAKNNVSFDSGNAYVDPLREVTPLYIAPPAPVSVPDDVSGPLAHAYKELTPTFMRNHIDVFERYGIYPDGSAGIQAMRIALDGMNRRAAMLQGADGNSRDGWVACSERMPNDKDYVWCWGRVVGWTEDDGFEAYYDATRNKWWAVTMDGEEPVRKVTHWQPLPAAPQQEVT